MKKAKKILALLLCAILLICATVAGTVAYLTSKQTVINTFTVGNVQIDLTETDTDGDSNEADNVTVDDVQRDKANAYKLIPGIAEKKDPVVTVKAGSEDCYVRVKVTVSVPNWNNNDDIFDYGNKTDTEAFDAWAKEFSGDYFMHNEKEVYGFNKDNWSFTYPVIDARAHTITYYLNYRTDAGQVVKVGDTDMNLEPPFTYIVPSGDLTNAQLAALAGMTINVEAHAIQTAGFVDSAEAWEVFDDQNS